MIISLSMWPPRRRPNTTGSRTVPTSFLKVRDHARLLRNHWRVENTLHPGRTHRLLDTTGDVRVSCGVCRSALRLGAVRFGGVCCELKSWTKCVVAVAV